jgi:hypothetical protein
MWFNSIIRAKPYQFWTVGAAWLLSARDVNCVVKTFNGQNPYLHLLKFKFIKIKLELCKTAKKLTTFWRKVRMNSNRHGPYELGYTCATKATTKGNEGASWSKSSKVVLVRIGGCNLPL